MLAWLLRLTLSVVLGLAAVSKLADPSSFADILRGHEFVTGLLVEPLAIAIPCAELALALSLALGLYSRFLPRVALALLTVFTVAVLYRLVAGNPGPCGCFGPGEAVTWRTVLRNLGFLCLAEALIHLDAPGPLSGRRLEAALMAAVLAVSAGAGGVAAAWAEAPYPVVAAGPAMADPVPAGSADEAIGVLDVVDMSGRRTAVEFCGDGPRPVLVVDVSCPLCGDVAVWLERNLERLPGVDELIVVVTRLPSQGDPPSPSRREAELRPVTFAHARDVVTGWGLRAPAYLDPEGGLASRLHIVGTPALLLVQDGGTVIVALRLAVVRGVHCPDLIDTIAGRMGVSLEEEDKQSRPARVERTPREPGREASP